MSDDAVISDPYWPPLPAGLTVTGMWEPSSVFWYCAPAEPRKNPCRVYWGSHGCDFERGHVGDCDCGCCECEDHPDPDSGCVGKAPYYGPDTRFYGEDAAARGLRLVEDGP